MLKSQLIVETSNINDGIDAHKLNSGKQNIFL